MSYRFRVCLLGVFGEVYFAEMAISWLFGWRQARNFVSTCAIFLGGEGKVSFR